MGFRKFVLIFLLLDAVDRSLSTYVENKAHSITKDARPVMETLTAFDAASTIHCSAACQRHEECQSFGYHKANARCSLYSEKSTTKFSTNYGYVYYILDSTSELTSTPSPPETTTKGGPRNVRFELDTSKSLTYDDAQKNCQEKKKGQLACIHSKEDQKTIEDMIGFSCLSYWFGLEKINGETGLYKWLDGKIINSADRANSFQNWDKDYPKKPWKNATNYAVLMSASGTWLDYEKSWTGCQICEIPK